MELSTTLNLFILPHDRGMQPYLDELDNYRQLGFSVLDCICCDADRPASPLLRDDWREWGAALAQASRERGIRYVQCHTPFYDFTAAAGGPDPHKELLCRRSVELAGMLGAKWIVMHPATDWSVPSPAASREENLAYFAPYVELGERCGVGIAIENMADLFARTQFPARGAGRSYGALAEELCDLIDRLASPYAGICWDFGHANLMMRDQAAALAAVGARLKAVHIHDNYGDADRHLPPFFGTVDWPAAMAALAHIGYGGVLDLEVKRIPLWLPLEMRNAQWQYVRAAGRQLLQFFAAAQ